MRQEHLDIYDWPLLLCVWRGNKLCQLPLGRPKFFPPFPPLQPSLSFSKPSCRTFKDRQGRMLVFVVRPQSQDPVWSGGVATGCWHPAASITWNRKEPWSSLSSINCRERTQENTPVIQAARGLQLSSLCRVEAVLLKTVPFMHPLESRLSACPMSLQHMSMKRMHQPFTWRTSSLHLNIVVLFLIPRVFLLCSSLLQST